MNNAGRNPKFEVFSYNYVSIDFTCSSFFLTDFQWKHRTIQSGQKRLGQTGLHPLRASLPGFLEPCFGSEVRVVWLCKFIGERPVID